MSGADISEDVNAPQPTVEWICEVFSVGQTLDGPYGLFSASPGGAWLGTLTYETKWLYPCAQCSESQDSK